MTSGPRSRPPSGSSRRADPTLPPVAVAAPDPGTIAAAEAEGLSVKPIAAGIPFVSVRATNARGLDDARIGALRALAPQVVWLDLGGTPVTDGGLAVVGRLPTSSAST